MRALRDPIALIEAGYALDGDDASWLKALAEQCATTMDARLGVAAWFFDLARPGGTLLQGPPVLHGTDPRWQLLLPLLAEGVPAAEVLRVRARTKTPASTLSTSLGFGGMDAGSPIAGILESMGGFSDVFSLDVVDPSGFGCTLAVPLAKITRVPPRTIAAGGRIVAHLVAGLRLRRALRPGATPDAIFDPGGRVQHAEGDAKESALLDRLRGAVQGIDRARGALRKRDPDAAVSLWQALVAGRWSLVDRFERDGRRFLVAHRNAPSAIDPRRLSESETVMGRYLAMGYSNKLAAYALGVSEGTVSGTIAKIRHKLGAGSRIDLIDRLTAGALASDGATIEVASGELAVITSEGREGRAARALPASLTAAERAVIEGVLAGATNAEIGRDRGSASRTIANQLAAAYRKLRVTSRAELRDPLRVIRSVLVSQGQLAYLGVAAVLTIGALALGVRYRHVLALTTRGYRSQLLARPRLVGIAIALAAFVVLAPLTGDPTWDALDATFMSVGCYVTAPWACATAYRAARGRASLLEVLLAAIAWCFVASWSYDAYLVVRDGVFPPTSRENFFASTILYVLGGLFFSLGQHRDRGLVFVFMDERWPAWSGDRWTTRGAATGFVIAVALATPVVVFMVWVVLAELGLLRHSP